MCSTKGLSRGRRQRGLEGQSGKGSSLLELTAQEIFMGKVEFARVSKGK